MGRRLGSDAFQILFDISYDLGRGYLEGIWRRLSIFWHLY
jgi:hypothetical protein